MQRMWIDQPSTLQLFHKFHGTNVLMVVENGNNEYVQIYWLSGPVISQMIPKQALSPGWK